MSLRVWLPLNGDLHNQGLSNISVTNNGATINTSGKIGSCYYFNGSAQYLQFSDSLGNIYSNDFSWAVWLKPTDDTRGIIISEYSSAGASNVAFELLANRVIRVYWNGSPDWSFSAIPKDVWSHVAITKHVNTIKVYINGVESGSKTTTLSARPSTAKIRIGDDYRGGTNVSYMGYMNDVRIYDHALSAMEIKEIARAKVLHYPLNHNGYGMPNLLKLGNIQQTGNSQTAHILYWYFDFSENLPTGTYTLSFDAKTSNGTDNAYVSYANGSSTIVRISDLMAIPSNWKHYTFTFTNAASNCNNIFFTSYKSYGGSTSPNKNNTGYLYVRNVKLENGDKATPFALAASEDTTTTEYDISGYCNNGTKIGTFTYSTDTPKYRVNTSFPGSTSCIKINENNVMAQYAQAMTINLWAKASSWAANTHFFSCTESGGFNTEAGNSGYLRFPIYVCTNAAQTSYSYKYDSNEIQLSALPTDEWVMLTWIYDTTGTRTYINGQLHHTYSNTSYGIRFNTNARLFLGCEASGANPTTPYFNGEMSDFRMYYTALSAQDILSLYHNSALVDEQGIIHGAIH